MKKKMMFSENVELSGEGVLNIKFVIRAENFIMDTRVLLTLDWFINRKRVQKEL